MQVSLGCGLALGGPGLCGAIPQTANRGISPTAPGGAMGRFGPILLGRSDAQFQLWVSFISLEATLCRTHRTTRLGRLETKTMPSISRNDAPTRSISEPIGSTPKGAGSPQAACSLSNSTEGGGVTQTTCPISFHTTNGSSGAPLYPTSLQFGGGCPDTALADTFAAMPSCPEPLWGESLPKKAGRRGVNAAQKGTRRAMGSCTTCLAGALGHPAIRMGMGCGR